MAKVLLPLILFAFIAISAAEPADLLPRAAPESLIIGYIQKAGNCSYSVNITTSCLSPFRTSAEIGILFGDAHGNQIYKPKLEVESGSAFGKCSENIFELDGPCTDQICYLYLYRNGSDDWVPHSVTISSADIETVEFKYNSTIPSNTWYGFDECQYIPPPPPPPPPAPPSAASHLPTQKWSVFFMVVLLISAVL